MLRKWLDRLDPHFAKNGKLKGWFPLYEAIDAFLYNTNSVTKGSPHVRDALDLKRMMTTVVIALGPAVLFGLYNIGYQVNRVLAAAAEGVSLPWQMKLAAQLGITPATIWGAVLVGAIYFIPVYIVCMAVGGAWEVLFAVVRKHEINEGFLVTGLLFPLILPPTIPLWQVAIGVSFGVVIGKEVFGGVGMNILNPALTARVFLFFAYPLQISGDAVWIGLDGVSSATPLARAAEAFPQLGISWWDAFWGFIPGSMGETSTFACLLGALVLIVTGIGCWRIMIAILTGMTGLSLLLNLIGSTSNPMFAMPPWWHLVLGGFAFGAVFMATDPVSAAISNTGKWIYGLLIGAMVVMIRVLNPAFPEGMMLAILFGNVFAPIIDKLVVLRHIKQRRSRYEER
ncbi:MAG: NADH:ubiquinone reductase (Na(+)-transporting) subunit B [Candidatus Aminicenantes bacterium]|nr:NADH:ubiquinone reductase (Na(+)-transporting) subunit B [Acidobacteriota bacterium]MBU4404991.1 NADH:ubiquinone reductase (Na(+)-transporting) subunit B [Acidobacteriota bacterium]MCG2811516.1 NADH:ubiquinone reductase (Na(+)-transporting) subunit B [Candidatus Aminicenantes bacterium]